VHREFKSISLAKEWARRIQLSPEVTVRYDPDDPSNNFVEELTDGDRRG